VFRWGYSLQTISVFKVFPENEGIAVQWVPTIMSPKSGDMPKLIKISCWIKQVLKNLFYSKKLLKGDNLIHLGCADLNKNPVTLAEFKKQFFYSHFIIFPLLFGRKESFALTDHRGFSSFNGS
jgi:hypothetical protein